MADRITQRDKVYALAQAKKNKDRLTQRDIEAADKKFKRFEKRFIPNKMGGMDTVMVPRDLTLEEKIIEKIRERAPKKKMGGGMMKKPMGYDRGDMVEKQRPGRSLPVPKKPSKGQDLRDRIKKTLPKTKEGMPVGGKMKKPKPGSYDYQLESTMKPSYKGMSMGGIREGTKIEKEKSEKIKDTYRRKRKEDPSIRIGREDIKVEKLNVGGMCRGMGAAIKGGKFGGVK